MSKRQHRVAAVLIAALAISGAASPALAGPDEPVGYGIDHPIVVDRDFKVVDIDGDGQWDWLNHSPNNTNLGTTPPAGHPDAIAAIRLEWDLSPTEIEAMRETRVIVDIASSEAHGPSRLTIDVAGTTIAGMTGNTGFGRVRGTDITAAVRSWIDGGASGPLTLDVTDLRFSVLTREFEGSDWNRPSPPQIFLIERVSEVASEVAVRGTSGEFRRGNYSRAYTRSVWEATPSGAERNALELATRIEFRVRLTECSAEAKDNKLSITYTHHNQVGVSGFGGLESTVVATNIENQPLEDGYLYVDVTEYVKTHLEQAFAFQIRISGPVEFDPVCKLAMNGVGRQPWHPEYTNVLALNGDRPEPAEFQWHEGSLGACKTGLGPNGVPEIEVATDSDQVEVLLVTHDYGQIREGRVVATQPGSFLDFGIGTLPSGSTARYRAILTRGDESEVVICGRAAAPVDLTRETLEAARVYAAERLAEKVDRGIRYGGWVYIDADQRRWVRVVVDLTDPGIPVASSAPLPDAPIISPFTAHDVALDGFDRISGVTMTGDGFVRALYRGGRWRSIWKTRSGPLVFGATADEVMEGLRSTSFEHFDPWWTDR